MAQLMNTVKNKDIIIKKGKSKEKGLAVNKKTYNEKTREWTPRKEEETFETIEYGSHAVNFKFAVA